MCQANNAVVTHVDAEIKPCPHCGTEARGPLPRGVLRPPAVRSRLKAYVLDLLIAQMLSEATILEYVLILHLALENWEKAAIERLLTLAAIHVDETSLRVDKKNHWIHVCSGGGTTLKFLHEKRGMEAMEAIGVIPRYGGGDHPRLLGVLSEL